MVVFFVSWYPLVLSLSLSLGGACGSGGGQSGGTPSSSSIVKSLPKIFVVSHKEIQWEKKDKTHLWPKRCQCLLGPLFFFCPITILFLVAAHIIVICTSLPCHRHPILLLPVSTLQAVIHSSSWGCCGGGGLSFVVPLFHCSHHPLSSLSSLLHYNTSTLWAGACSSGFSWSCHPSHGCAILVLSHCYSVREVEAVLGWSVVVVQTQTMCDMDDAELEYPCQEGLKRIFKGKLRSP